MFQLQAEDGFSPSMRKRIDLDLLYRRATQRVGRLDCDAPPARVPPSLCPVTLDQLLSAPCRELEAAFRDAAA